MPETTQEQNKALVLEAFDALYNTRDYARAEHSLSHLPPIATHTELTMPKTTPEQNKALILEAFDILFNKRDYAAAERFWSPHYIQHSAHIAPGSEGSALAGWF
jgi:hypothetical protein